MKHAVALAALIACIALACPDAGAAVRIDGDPEAPSYYWPGPEGLRLVRDSAKYRDGELAYRATNEMTCGPAAEHDGMPVRLDDFLLRRTDPDGSVWRLECVVMQAVNDSVSCTLGAKYGEGPMEMEEVPYIDLHAPLRTGATWSSVVDYPVSDPGLNGIIPWRIDAEVVETGVVVTVPAGTFSNCVHVRETGRSVDSHALEEGPAAGRRVRFESIVDRWWSPGLGCIREQSVTRTVTAGMTAEALTEVRFESDLVEIDRP